MAVPMTLDQWLAAFEQSHGRKASAQEYQEALAAGEVALPPEAAASREAARRRTDPFLAQMGEGAGKLAAGAAGYARTRVAPAFAQALSSARGAAAGRERLAAWARLAWFVPWLLGLIALFLPAFSAQLLGFSASVGFFGQEMGGVGGFFLFFLILSLCAQAASFLVRGYWPRVIAGSVQIGVAAAFLVICIVFASSAASQPYGEVGAGIVLMLLCSVGMLACSVVCVLPVRPEDGLEPVFRRR